MGIREGGENGLELWHEQCVASGMKDYPIDPPIELRMPVGLLRSTNRARAVIAQKAATDRSWRKLERQFERISDEWTAIDAVVALEVLALEDGLLVEEASEHPAIPQRRAPRVPARSFPRRQPVLASVVNYPSMEEGVSPIRRSA